MRIVFSTVSLSIPISLGFVGAPAFFSINFISFVDGTSEIISFILFILFFIVFILFSLSSIEFLFSLIKSSD